MAAIGKGKNNGLRKDTACDHLERLESFHQLEEEAAKKDQQISQLVSRMREYEMGEYGLAEAVSEIKECRKVIRARDWEIEKLTDEINSMKLQASELTEKMIGQQELSEYSRVLSERSLQDRRKQSFPEEDKKVTSCSNKISQCHLPVQSSQYAEEMYTILLQNEQLRIQLSKVCEEAMEMSKHLHNLNKEDHLKCEEAIKMLKANVKWDNSCMKSSKMFLRNIFGKYDVPDDLHEAALKHISHEDLEGQEVLHKLLNQVKLLKSEQMALIRRYIIMSDREENLRKENIKLRRAINLFWRKHSHDCSYFKVELGRKNPSNYMRWEDTTLLKELNECSQNSCQSPVCKAHTKRLIGLIENLQEKISVLQQLLEIAQHQTQAAEAVNFTQEAELKLLRNQFTLFQAQSDEKMLLGKLAVKVLQLQFSHAACIYELKRYKSDKQTLQDWYSILKKDYEENGRRFVGMYLDAQDKVKQLREVLKDLCQRCNSALSSYIGPELKS